MGRNNGNHDNRGAVGQTLGPAHHCDSTRLNSTLFSAVSSQADLTTIRRNSKCLVVKLSTQCGPTFNDIIGMTSSSYLGCSQLVSPLVEDGHALDELPLSHEGHVDEVGTGDGSVGDPASHDWGCPLGGGGEWAAVS